MTGRRLGPDEQALWARVTGDVRPLRRATPVLAGVLPSPIQKSSFGSSPSTPPAAALRTGSVENHAPIAQAMSMGLSAGRRATPKPPADTLDASWDKRLRRGLAAPDRTLDLHGMTQAAAHAALEATLGQALANGERLLLLVTGRPPPSGAERPHGRGAIRAATAGWLGQSAHASRIAAVRAAHPRHGGAGALYVVLRRARGG